MRLPLIAFPVSCLLSLAPAVALAQPAAPAPKPPAAPDPAAEAPAAPPGPRPIEVSDAALTPVPPAKRTLGSWQEALKIMSSRSTELRIAIQEIARAEGLAQQALGAVLPNIDARGSVTHFFITQTVTTPLGPVTSPDTPTARASITVTQPILAPRAWYGVGTANLSVEAAKLSVEDQQRIVLAAVADNVVSVVTAERVSEINRVGLQSALQRLELTRRRERLGTGTRLDIVRADQDVALARATLVSGDEALRKAREALGLALGSVDPYGVSPTISLNALEREMRSTCALGNPAQRADVRAARTQLEISERGVTDAKLALAPYADVSSTFEVSSNEGANGKNYQWSIQALLTIPIWDGGGRYGVIHAAKASAEQQKARVEATERAVSLENTQATRGVTVAEQSRVVSEQARDLARETARLTQVAYEAGTATSFEVIDAAQKQRQAELDLAVREFNLVRAKVTALLAAASCKY